MPYSHRHVVIVVKTYPELSSKHTETVCTVALDAHTGKPLRLYPVPLRYLGSNAQYRLYDEISVPVEKSGSDPRPESFKIDARGIVQLGHMDSSHHWRERRELVFRDPSWHFPSRDAVLAANAATHLSIGLIKPSVIVDVQVTAKADTEREVFEKKSGDIQTMKEADLFDPTYVEMMSVPHHRRAMIHPAARRRAYPGVLPHAISRIGMVAAGKPLAYIVRAIRRDLSIYRKSSPTPR